MKYLFADICPQSAALADLASRMTASPGVVSRGKHHGKNCEVDVTYTNVHLVVPRSRLPLPGALLRVRLS